MAAPRPLDNDGTPIPHAFLMPRARKVGVWCDPFDGVSMWAWRCAACGCVGWGMSHAEAVRKGLDHLDTGCRRPRLKAVR